MLSELSVRNFALIDQITLAFEPGFNVLTGETGAGKSIIVGALNLILGGRAYSDLIREGSDEAEVQALFTPENMEPLNQRLAGAGLPEGDEVIVRRVLSRSGRNKIYINGGLATLAQLSEFGRELVSVSGQHEHQRLLDPDHQLWLLDGFGGLMDRRLEMTEAYERQVRLAGEKRKLEKEAAEAREKSDLFDFQAREIEAAELVEGEDAELEGERRLIRNAEKIYRLVHEAYERLYGETGAVIEGLDVVRGNLEEASGLDERLADLCGRVEESYHQLDDAAGELRGHLDLLTFDPARLEEIEDRLALLGKLKRKYGPELADVMQYGQRAAGRMDHLSGLEKKLAAASANLEKAEKEARDLAVSLSRARREAAAGMAGELAGQLQELGMPKARFDVRFTENPEEARPGPTGLDEVEFMISPNLGEPLRPLARIASGGELSRTTLGVKSMLAGRERIQTIIFDEVDAGIGGAVAEVVGRKIARLAAHHQVVCITHLPQIAVFGRSHQHVYKEARDGRTITGIRPLEEKERVEEIARMISGAAPTKKALETAWEMISRSRG